MQQLYDNIGYIFNDTKLFIEAISHPSNKRKTGLSYERLEFLGDAVLGLIINEMLFVNNLKENEGILSKKRAHLVSREICYQIGITIGIPDAIILSDGEQANGGRLLLANVANCLEAIIAAIYIDSGYDLVYVRKFINKYWGDFITQNNTELIGNDSKTALQEWSQMRFKVVPVYNIIGHEGNPHSPIFKIEVAIRDLPRITGTGKSKKDAEKDAASKMLKLIKQLDI